VRYCLNKNVAQRPSAAQLLRHKWLQEMGKLNEKHISKEDEVEILKNLQQFSKASKFQKTILSVLLGLRADKEELAQLKIAFNKMDKNGDGCLTTNEI